MKKLFSRYAVIAGLCSIFLAPASTLRADHGLWFSAGPTLIDLTRDSPRRPPAGFSPSFVLPIFQQPEALAFHVSLTNSGPTPVALGPWPDVLVIEILDENKESASSSFALESQRLLEEWATESGETVAWEQMTWSPWGRFLTYSGPDVEWQRRSSDIQGLTTVLGPGETISAHIDIDTELDLTQFEGWLELKVKMPLSSGETLSSQRYLLDVRPPGTASEDFEVARVRAKRNVAQGLPAEAEDVLWAFVVSHPDCSAAWRELTYHFLTQERWSDFASAAGEWRRLLVDPPSDDCADYEHGASAASDPSAVEFDQWIEAAIPVPAPVLGVEASCQDFECSLLADFDEESGSWARWDFGDGSEQAWTQDRSIVHEFLQEGTYLVRVTVFDPQLQASSGEMDLEVQDFLFFLLNING